MKKTKVLLLLGVAALSSCDGNKNQSQSNEEKSVIQQNIDTFSRGFFMYGEVTQTRTQITGVSSTGEYIYSTTKESNTYNTEVGFENVTRNGFRKVSTQQYDGEEQTIEDYTYFEDEDGLAYKEKLNYKNELERDYSINLSSSSFVYNGFYNFFTILNEEDFTETSSTRYDLDLGKTAIITNNLLYSLNSGFATAAKEAYFTMTDGVFTSFDVAMKDYLYADSTTGYYYKVENVATFNFAYQGDYSVSSTKVYEDKGYTSLDKALKSVGNNFTMTVKMNALSQTTGEAASSYQDFYFTGDKIYVHAYSNTKDSAPNRNKDYYLAPDANGTLYSYVYDSTSGEFVKKNSSSYASLYQGLFTYDDYLPKVGEISSNLFVKDGDKYKAEEDVAATLPNYFYLQNPPYKKNASNNFIDVEITLSGDSIDKVTLPYSYTDFMEGTIITGTYEITYNNIGQTELPTL